MGITCEKQYTLTVNPGTSNLISYYKFEEVDGSPEWIDSVSGINMAYPGGNTKSASGLIGNAMTYNGSWLWAETAQVPNFNFAGKSCFVRFWFYPKDSIEFGDVLMLDLSYIAKGFQVYRFGGGVDGIYGFVQSTSNDWTYTEGYVATGVVLNSWNRAIAWYENGVGFGLKLNNDASVTIADVTGLTSASRWLRAAVEPSVPAGNEGKIDEVGVWDRIWTPAEMLYDWNSGNGRTYPDVPS